MNFLAHLHLAHLAQSSLPGNLMADFVRGKPDAFYPADVVAGIYMHRRVDVLTDNLPEVREARDWFRPETRRVAPVTLDVMWDHFLSRHWARISPEVPLDQFVAHAHALILPALPDAPERFVNLNEVLWRERWMERYRDMDFIARVLNGMASRRPKLAALRDSWDDLNTHYAALERQFWRFYPRMMEMARQQTL
ncbi:ACP phosphodiesterase [Cronobacter muytjensii]|uniref:ACP phosphodiesterase n=1 Tax=Cronobacter muytjensii TaxID=413501 RepID=A0A2T7AQI7_9ENTR|nr:ACP phosphodiesterase [Cronobacter muytjensii]ALB71623.1 ACP phosphodiesterase [Cronobacter muytjensii ATCC 51329]EGT4339206.1 ACP phosphodiesterase [Cronobacter muytjensii]EKS1845526.1 ACP phosphodiesterase [Cronobacter muytjensii]ELY3982689.1 ACP phosphodiesterase [Cronobacter muytjensii]ELY4520566.1 ACP phosphodiesterase [Cronobacter muytjensii]